MLSGNNNCLNDQPRAGVAGHRQASGHRRESSDHGQRKGSFMASSTRISAAVSPGRIGRRAPSSTGRNAGSSVVRP